MTWQLCLRLVILCMLNMCEDWLFCFDFIWEKTVPSVFLKVLSRRHVQVRKVILTLFTVFIVFQSRSRSNGSLDHFQFSIGFSDPSMFSDVGPLARSRYQTIHVFAIEVSEKHASQEL